MPVSNLIFAIALAQPAEPLAAPSLDALLAGSHVDRARIERHRVAMRDVEEVAIVEGGNPENEQPLLAVHGAGGWVGLFPLVAPTYAGRPVGSVLAWRVLRVGRWPSAQHSRQRADTVRVELALTSAQHGLMRAVVPCRADAERVVCAPVLATAGTWLAPGGVDMGLDVALAGGRPLFARAYRDPSDYLAHLGERLDCAGSIVASPFDAVAPVAADGLEVGFGTSVEMCQQVLLIVRRAPSTPGPAWTIAFDAFGVPGERAMPLGLVHAGPGLFVARGARHSPITGTVGPRGERAELVVDFELVVWAPPAGDASVEVTRIVTGMRIQAGDAVLERWRRSVEIEPGPDGRSPIGLVLRNDAGRLAHFREVGRFAWADIPELVRREAAAMRATLDPEAELGGLRQDFLEGYLEPQRGSLTDEWRPTTLPASAPTVPKQP